MSFNLHRPRILLLQRLQRQQVIPEDRPVVEEIVVRHPMRRMIRLLRDLQQTPRLQPRPLILPDPRQFEFRFLVSHAQ